MTETIDGTFQKLHELTQNLWWSWQPDIRAIFRELDPETWRIVHHNPVALLQRMHPEEIARRVQDLEMQTRIDQAHRRLQTYLRGGESWGLTHAGPLLARPVAYFSAEFGLHQSLPIYSGGLGVLAGDHLKSMSDLGAPVVGVGLLYHQGYVHQLIDENGWQQDLYEPIARRRAAGRAGAGGRTARRRASASSSPGATSSCASGGCTWGAAISCCSTPATTPTRPRTRS